jgi:NADPH2:quinone reductase
MKAIVVGENGLGYEEVATPRPKPGEVLVKVRAASLNRADLGVVAGHRHGAMGGPGTVPGLEWAGEVAEVGSEVEGVAVGDRVMCSGAGGYAEYAVTDHGRALPIPDGLSFETAATLPLALKTMHDAIVTQGRLQPGEAILIQGASSGVGLVALQIARLRGAGIVIGTSTDPGRRARLPDFGATLALDTSDPAWPERVREATQGRGVEVIVDQVSGALANGNLQAAAVLGRIVNVGRLGGTRGEFDFDLHALKRITYTGVTFRTRSVEEVREIARRMRADLWPAVERGDIALPIDGVHPLAEAGAALERMRANRHFGKILLVP